MRTDSSSERELLHQNLAKEIIGAFFTCYNQLGYGFLEQVYHGAMKVEPRKREIPFETEKSILIRYEGQAVGEYRADLICDGKILVEIKAGQALHPSAWAQTLNYLGASGLPLGLLLFFGPRPEFKRIISRKFAEKETLL